MKKEANTTLVGRLRRHAGYPVVFMFVVTFFFSAVLIGFSRFTAEQVDANRQIRFERAVLSAVGADVGERSTPAEIHRVFQSLVQPPSGMSGGAYLYMKDGAIAAYAVPMEGKGFWNVIRGVIGVEPDRETITGIAFHEQNETPGLGAEIVKTSFRKHFRGLRVAEGASPVGLVPVGTSLKGGEVHAITGATQTCKKLEKIINEALNGWRNRVGSGAR